jgi:hypothetical protein
VDLGLGDRGVRRSYWAMSDRILKAGALGGELGGRDRVGGEIVELGGLLRADRPATTGSRRGGEGRPPFVRDRTRGRRLPQHREGTRAGRIVVRLLGLGEPSSMNRVIFWQTRARSSTRAIANRAASRRSAPARTSRASGRSTIARRASVRASAGSDLVRWSRRLPKSLESSGLTTATGTPWRASQSSSCRRPVRSALMRSTALRAFRSAW